MLRRLVVVDIVGRQRRIVVGVMAVSQKCANLGKRNETIVAMVGARVKLTDCGYSYLDAHCHPPLIGALKDGRR